MDFKTFHDYSFNQRYDKIEFLNDFVIRIKLREEEEIYLNSLSFSNKSIFQGIKIQRNDKLSKRSPDLRCIMFTAPSKLFTTP